VLPTIHLELACARVAAARRLTSTTPAQTPWIISFMNGRAIFRCLSEPLAALREGGNIGHAHVTGTQVKPQEPGDHPRWSPWLSQAIRPVRSWRASN
jgi:hypothetical protein